VEDGALAQRAVRKRGRPVGADSEATRRTILSAARDLIAERGYHAATFQQIAKHAGVSRPTLHYYFATREDLYERLLADVCDQLRGCATAAAQAGSLRCQLAAFLREMHRLTTVEPALMKIVVTARIDHHRAVHRHESASGVVSTVHAFYDAVVVDAVRRGELARDTDAHAVADLLAALFWGLGFHAGFVADGHDGTEAAEVAKQLFQLLDGGLLTSAQKMPVDA